MMDYPDDDDDDSSSLLQRLMLELVSDVGAVDEHFLNFQLP